jgi:squalene-hopene/tetraprenyl-beta-curcumene cyclase
MKLIQHRLPALALSASLLCFTTNQAFAQASSGAVVSKASPNPEHLSLKVEIKLAIQRGNKFLQGKQSEKGSWSDETVPAFTALAVQAGMTDPNREEGKTPPHLQKGYDFIMSKVQKDGGIYGKGLATYSTSLGIMALAASGNPDYTQTILNARTFLINLQTNWKPGPDGKPNILNGGVGYGGTYPHSDMSNSHLAFHAIRTAELFAKEGDPANKVDLDWDAAIKFISACQNLKSTNPLPEAGNDGSFVYFPGNSMAGSTKDAEGKESLRGYGSMSYAGLLSLIHAELDEKDERVVSVKKWLSDNYTLEENPGMDLQGLFYYYHTMAKALSAANISHLTLKNGTKVDWRKELATKVLTLQREDGSWVNENNRWMETNPDLVTCYAVLTLNQVYNAIAETK